MNKVELESAIKAIALRTPRKTMTIDVLAEAIANLVDARDTQAVADWIASRLEVQLQK